MKHSRKNKTQKIRSLRPKKRIWKSKLFWLGLALAITLGGLTYAVLFLKEAQIQNITILGNQEVEQKQISEIATNNITHNFIFANSKSIFLLNTNNLKKIILDSFAEVENVKITKKYPNSITIDIVERKPAVVFCENDAREVCFFSDNQGVAFKHISEFSDSFVIANNPLISNIKLKDKVLESNILDIILKMNKILQNDFQVSIKSATIANPLMLKTSEGWSVYLDPSSQPDLQIQKLTALLEQEVSKEERLKLKYIYLQYQDRAYYK